MRSFVTLGFERRPFDRLLRAIDSGIEQRIISADTLVQRGHSQYIPKHCASRDFLEYDEMMTSIREAEIVIAHAGVGTVLLCLKLEKVPILFPRISHLGEHVDDHQVEFAETMQALNRVFVAHNTEQLFDRYRQFPSQMKSLSPNFEHNGGMRLAEYLKNLLSFPSRG